jgi:hypothetical protein
MITDVPGSFTRRQEMDSLGHEIRHFGLLSFGIVAGEGVFEDGNAGRDLSQGLTLAAPYTVWCNEE